MTQANGQNGMENERPERLHREWGGFVSYAHNGLRGECLRTVRHFDIGALPWDEPGRDLREKGLTRVKRSTTRCVLRLTMQTGEGREAVVYAKRNKARDFWKSFASLFRASKSHREWSVGWRALEREIPTAAPLLWADRRRFGLMSENYLLLLGIEPSVSFAELWSELDTDEERRKWLERLGAFIRYAHDRGFAHDDLSADHILVGCEGECRPEAAFFHFIDLDQARFTSEITAYRRAHNFFQIYRSLPSGSVDRAHREAFYRGYSRGKWTDEHIGVLERSIARIELLKKLSAVLKPRKWLRRFTSRGR